MTLITLISLPLFLLLPMTVDFESGLGEVWRFKSRKKPKAGLKEEDRQSVSSVLSVFNRCRCHYLATPKRRSAVSVQTAGKARRFQSISASPSAVSWSSPFCRRTMSE